MAAEADPIRAALGSTLDADHVEAVIADRVDLGAELTTGEALALARWCDDFSDPNLAAEAAIGRRYQGIRGVSRPVTKAGNRPAPPNPAGTIVQAAEPAAFR